VPVQARSSVALRLISLASFGNMVAAVLAIVGARDGFAFEASHTKARTSRFFPALSAALTTAAHLSLSPAFNSAITGATISAALVGSALTASKTAAPNCSVVADATVTPGGSDRGPDCFEQLQLLPGPQGRRQLGPNKTFALA
jgi:hypothetical protein